MLRSGLFFSFCTVHCGLIDHPLLTCLVKQVTIIITLFIRSTNPYHNFKMSSIDQKKDKIYSNIVLRSKRQIKIKVKIN